MLQSLQYAGQCAVYRQHLVLATGELGTLVGLAFCQAREHFVNVLRVPASAAGAVAARPLHRRQVFMHRAQVAWRIFISRG